MIKKGTELALLCLFVILLSTGCAQKPVGKEAESIKRQEPVQTLSPAEQQEQAYELFKQILFLSDSPDREKHLPAIKNLYREIIEKYPDIGLAQESYLRLILLAKEEQTVAGDAEAEKLYHEFTGKYPDSKLTKIIEKELE